MYLGGKTVRCSKEELLDRLARCVLEMEEQEAESTAKNYLEAGYPPKEGIVKGLIEGMNKAGELYDAEEYFVTDILLCSDALYAGLAVLKKAISPDMEEENKDKVIIGVVEGDIHDIGKNLVRTMLETAGFEIYDLGKDVPPDTFVDKAVELEARLICLSTLMTTTMSGMALVIEKLKERGIRDKVKVMVGGSPVSQQYADAIGADGYSENAVAAVKLAKALLEKKS